MFTMKTFELTDENMEAIKKWDDAETGHKCTLKPGLGSKKYVGAIGGNLSIEFIPTTIGMVKIVKCFCGAKLDLSDDF